MGVRSKYNHALSAYTLYEHIRFYMLYQHLYGLYGEAPPERVTFFRLQVCSSGKGREIFIIIFRKDAPYSCISLFIKHYMKMTTRRPKAGM